MDNARAIGPYWAARWQLAGVTLPPVEETIAVGALARRALMSQARQLYGPRDIPPALSGHGLPFRARHEHLFCLPEDADGDGFIDHIVTFRHGGFDNRTLRCLVALRHLWAGAWGEWQVIDHWVAKRGEGLGTLVGRSRSWVSTTPFFAPRHMKEKYGETAQLRWQCCEMGLPEPARTVSLTNGAASGPPPLAFRLQREGRDYGPPQKRGNYWRLDFMLPVDGPIALGYGCHFGLGLFRIPEKDG